MNKIVKRMLVLVLSAIMALAMASTAFAADENASAYISQMINYYKTYQDAAHTDIARLNADLAKVDTTQAEAWGLIMDYWAWVNREMEVNVNILPDGLPNDDSMCITVLGLALNDDGTMKDELIGRLTAALESAKKYPNAYIACTGGGTAKYNRHATEADQMAAWLIEQGIDEKRIIVENRSKSTVQNAQFTYEILREEYPQISCLAMISSDYHIPRGCVLYNSQLILSAYNAGDKVLDIVSNAGYAAGHKGYESISLQADNVAQIAGITLQKNEKPKLSILTEVTAGGKTEYAVGDELEITVTASYDSGFSYDVTETAEMTGYDSSKKGTQVVTVTYVENDIEKTAEIEVEVKAVTLTSLVRRYGLPVLVTIIIILIFTLAALLRKKFKAT